jgi:8-oxo-dGTP diphosphatase
VNKTINLINPNIIILMENKNEGEGLEKQKQQSQPFENILKYKIDSYKCVRIELTNEENYNFFSKCEDNEIEGKIKSLVEEFQNFKCKAIWLIIPIQHSHLIKYFAAEKFLFHHTENETELTMQRWLLSTPNNLPKYASHYLGVGALIIDSQGKILLVKEKHTLKPLQNMWKIPTGLSEKGETIQQAVIREVKEETGLDITFEGILCCREMHPYLFNTSDIFFICLCKCEDGQNIDIIKGNELKECKWFDKEGIEKILEEKNFSTFSTAFFTSILEALPDKIKTIAWKPGKEIKALRSNFIFHSPNF